MEEAAITSPKQTLRPQFVVAFLALLALWFVLCRQLSGEWSVNEQYSYGWFVPFFALFLFWLRWEDRPETESRKSKGESRKRRIALAIGVVALLLLFPIRLFEVANPDWRPVDWIHTAAVVTLTLLVIWAAGGKAWLRHFAFPICFFFVAVPWISPIEEPIVQGLMRTVAAVATEAITLFGVPAQLEGNLIRVGTGLVGVNEACSGVRSLQTSLMIGLLFGELKRLSVSKRIVLVFGALAIAVIANFVRAFFLVWVAATQSVSAIERWHDFAGYTIVAAVFIGSLLLAAILNRNKKVESGKAKGENGEPARTAQQSFRLSPFPFLILFLWLLAVEIGVEAWYRMHERGLVAREQWTARWPETAQDFRDIHLDERTKRILRFDEGRGATWRMPGRQKTEVGDQRFATANPSVGGSEVKGTDSALLYFFRWRAGSNSALLANVHRPDVCLPASGWIQAGDYGIRFYPVSAKLSLPFRHFLFSQGGATAGSTASASRQRFAHAFYCLREDRARNEGDETLAREEFAQEPSDWSRRERLGLIMQGRRHLGQQVMEFVLITAQETNPDQAEAKFAAVLPEIVETN